jgi:hypothetical protein
VVAEQPFDHDEALRLDILGPAERAVVVVVDGLEDRLVTAQVAQVLTDDVHEVAVGIQRRDPELRPLLAVVAVVVVHPDVGDVLPAEDLDEPLRDRRLPGRGVADDTEDDRACHVQSPLRCSVSPKRATLRPKRAPRIGPRDEIRRAATAV